MSAADITASPDGEKARLIAPPGFQLNLSEELKLPESEQAFLTWENLNYYVPSNLKP